MLTLGGQRAVRIRLGCAGAFHVERGARRGLLIPHSPLRRRLLLRAKRTGRSDGSNEDSDGESAATVPRDRGAVDPPDNLAYWEAQVADMNFRDIQVQLRNRGLNAGGRKDEVVNRLAEALLREYQSNGSITGVDNASQQQEAEAAQAYELMEAVLDRLDEMTYNDLRRMCSQWGLSVAGKKNDLQQRLATAMVESGEGLEGLLGSSLEEQEEEREVDQEGRSTVTAAPAEGAVNAAMSDDPASLLPELLSLKAAELVALLREYGATTRGTKQELALRLAECMVAEVKTEIGSEAVSEQYGEYADEQEYEGGDEQQQEEEEEEARFEPALLSPADRKVLLADITNKLYAENQRKTRQQLFNTLKQLRRNPSYQSRAVLLDQLVRCQAEERLEEELQNAQSDPVAARHLADRLKVLLTGPSGLTGVEESEGTLEADDGLGAGSGASSSGVGVDLQSEIDYSQLTPVDVRRMRVEDLRDALRHFGMDSSGNKYDMQERLLARVKMQPPPNARGRGRPPLTGIGTAASVTGENAAAASGGISSAAAAEERYAMVLGMSLRTLREELDARLLPTSGSRNELQARLLAALRQEAEEARALSTGLQTVTQGREVAAEEGAVVAGEAGGGMSEAEHIARRLIDLAELPVEERGAAVVAALAAAPERLITLGMEAPVDVAVVAGCPPGRLDLAQRSLEEARVLLDHLYTAHMPSPLDRISRPPPQLEDEEEPGEDEADAGPRQDKEVINRLKADKEEGAAASASAEVRPELDATLSYAPTAGGVARPPQGVVVSVWWLDGTTGQSTLLSPAQVYAATAAELMAGCLPAVHRELLAVPPPSPLSLDNPDLDGPVPPSAGPPAAPSNQGTHQAATTATAEGGPSFFPDVTSLAAHLRGVAHVVFPAVPAGSTLYCELQRVLEAEGVPNVGSGDEAAALAHDRLGVIQRLKSLSYPVLPQLEISMTDVVVAVREAAMQTAEKEAAGGADGGEDEEEDREDLAIAAGVAAASSLVRAKAAAWCKEQGFDPERQLFVFRPRHSVGSNAVDVETALGVDRLAELIGEPLVEAVMEAAERGEEALSVATAASSVVVEPVPSSPSTRFVCTVVETPDGPVALLPSEVELYDTEIEILKHNSDMAEWSALQAGADDEQVAAARADALAVEPESWRAVYDPWVTLPATSSMRLHTPPRLSRKLIHAIRHAAARLFGELGLRDVATVEGWVDLPKGYADQVEEAAGGKGEEMDDVPTLYDPDPFILARIAEQEVERIAADPAPLEEYYDYGTSWHADLSAFDPAIRLNADTNGEGATLRISGVAADLPLDTRHPAVLQAAEVGLPHAALLRNLANNALRRAAAAGNRRALVPSEPYRSPEEAVKAAAVSAILTDAASDAPPPAEEWAGPVQEFGEGEDLGEKARAAVAALEGEEEKADQEEERVGLAAAAAAAAAAEPLELGPEPLQLPMPPQLPLYHTAVLQHLREADEFDTWIEDMDPDHWDDADGPARVQMMADAMEEQMEEETGLPRGYGDDPNPVAADMVSAVALEGHQMALDAAVEALGDFGATLSKMMLSVPLDEAVEADAEIPLTRVKELPHPDERLPDGIEGTAADPRVVAAWQMAAICELARRHGWEVLEAVDAAEEAAAAAAEREAAGIPEPTPEEEAAAAAASQEEQTVLEAMCDNDDEVMELRTGLITPVQLYLRFRERQARRPPASHPLAIASAAARAADGEAASTMSDEEGDEFGSDGDLGAGLDEGEQLDEAEEGEEEETEAAGGVRIYLPQPEDAPEPEPGSEAAVAAAAAASFGPASSGPGLEGPTAYTWNLPPDDAVELPVFASAGLTAGAMAVQAAVDGKQDSLARHVAATARERLDAAELEALGLMELGFEMTPVDQDKMTGLPVLAAIGPALDGLNQELILDPFGGELSQLPSFRPLAAIMEAEGVEPPTTADLQDDEGEAGLVNWEEEDGFARGVARAAAAAASRRVDRASVDDGLDEVEEVEAGDEEEEGAIDEDANADFLIDDDGDDEEGDVDPIEYSNPTLPLVTQALAEGDVEGAELAALVPPMNPTRVWVVMGGDGHWGREAGLVAGANVISKLSKYQDLVVEPFLLVPMGEGRNTDARRAELLRRRTEYIAGLGMDPEEDLPESMSLDRLRVSAPMATSRPETQCIYAVTMATVSRPSVPEALASLERTAAREGVALHSLTEVQRQQRAAHRDVQAELAAAGLEGVASLWDEDVLGQPGPPPARPLDLDAFAEDAKRAGAVVLIAARGEMAECGHLQTLLELQGVACVGSGSQQMAWLWDRTASAEMLQDLHAQGVDAPPRLLLPYEELVTAADLDERDAEELMDRLRAEVVEDPPEGISLLVRPAADVASTGVARLACGADVVAYMAALRDGDACLPADTLSYPHGEIRLPPLPPPVLSFELFVETAPLFMVLAAPEATAELASTTRGSASRKGAAADSGAAVAAGLHCGREKGWVEVSFTLMGPLGAMSCLPPAMRAAVVSESDLTEAAEADHQAAGELVAASKIAESALAEAERAAASAAQAATDEGSAEDEQETAEEVIAAEAEAAVMSAAGAVATLPPPGIATAALLAHAPYTWVVPPPEEALSAAALDDACKRAALIADRLGVRGLVQIEAFVASDSGELAVYDINGSPDLGPNSPIWRQAAAAGMLPQDFLRELLGLAIGAATSTEGRRATFEAQLEAMEREGWDLDEDETYDSQYGAEDEEGELRLRGDEDEEDVESEGGRGGLVGEDEGEEDDMLGQLEEMRVGAGAEEEVEE
ncbi:hypothetical protein Vafri_18360, partial [Volvox africanus]